MSGPFRDFRSARTDVERELDSWLTRIENTRSIGTSCAATTTDDPWRSRPRTAATGSAATSRRPVVHPSQFDAQFCSARFICAEDEPGLPELLGQLAVHLVDLVAVDADPLVHCVLRHRWWSVFGKPKRYKGSKPGTP